MQLTSTAFQSIETIPARYTGDGEDISPPLLWADLPNGTASLALLCEDPDAPSATAEQPFVHWVLFNLDPGVGMLPDGIPAEAIVREPVPCEQGVNSFGELGYRGPAPPAGHGMHRYVFRLFALARALELPPRAHREDLLRAMREHLLKEAHLTATYERWAKEKSA